MVEIRNRWTDDVLHTFEADTLLNVNLIGVNLIDADLSGMHLNHAKLGKANLRSASLIGANLEFTDLTGADLSDTDLTGANLTAANLSEANLSEAILDNTMLSSAKLNRAKLNDASLISTNLREANLNGATLVDARLIEVILSETILTDADLTHAELSETIVANCPTLHCAKGLDTLKHLGPCSLDTRTLRTCVNDLPDVFLLSVGYNLAEIDYLRSMYANGVMGGGIRYYSCFLSYAHSDDAFVEKLRTDLIKNGVNCWKDDQLKTGTKWRDEIDKAIGGHEKLVLVCSRRSLYREQVVREIQRALDDERSSGTQKFFPVRLDDHIFSDEMMDDARENVRSGEWKTNWLQHVRKYQAADFSKWKKDGEYQKALTKLLHDLKNPEKR